MRRYDIRYDHVVCILEHLSGFLVVDIILAAYGSIWQKKRHEK
jgi:hypothetical protein